jgi:hypothetical protein
MPALPHLTRACTQKALWQIIHDPFLTGTFLAYPLSSGKLEACFLLQQRNNPLFLLGLEFFLYNQPVQRSAGTGENSEWTRDMHVLITGEAGFIESHLAERHLTNGNGVHHGKGDLIEPPPSAGRRRGIRAGRPS